VRPPDAVAGIWGRGYWCVTADGLGTREETSERVPGIPSEREPSEYRRLVRVFTSKAPDVVTAAPLHFSAFIGPGGLVCSGCETL